jgi:hypothetical protein
MWLLNARGSTINKLNLYSPPSLFIIEIKRIELKNVLVSSAKDLNCFASYASKFFAKYP